LTTFTPKAWKNDPIHSTPISAAALIDLEERVTDYAAEVFWVNAREVHGAKGDGSTDDKTALKAALAAAKAAGGGVVYLPVGTYITSEKLTIPSNVRIVGDGWVSTMIKAKSGFSGTLFEGENYATTGIKNGGIEHLTIDGNKANTEAVVGVKLASKNFYFNKVIVRECDSHGFSMKIVEGELEVAGLDNYMTSCRAINCEGKGFNIEAHDTTLYDCQAIQCKETGFYWTVNGYMINCHSWCYDSSIESATKTGYRLATSVHCVGCIAEGATERQVEFTGNVASWVGGEVFNGVSKPNAALFEFNGGASISILDPWCHEFGTGGAFKFTTNGENSIIRARCFDSAGKQITQGTPAEDIYWKITPGGGTPLGEAAYDKTKQRSWISFAPGTVPNKTDFLDSSTGRRKFKDSNGTLREYQMGAEEEVASANTINISTRASTFKVTGTTEIKKITATYAGHVVQLRFTGALTVKKGENLANISRDMETQSGVVLSLFCDGTDWYEISRQESSSGGTVASASTISVKNYAKIVKISGSTEIKKINATYNGHVVTLVFTETAKLVDGENLKLSATTAAASADDAFTLICDGTNWFQVSPLQVN